MLKGVADLSQLRLDMKKFCSNVLIDRSLGWPLC